jgi:hypothetical protein
MQKIIFIALLSVSLNSYAQFGDFLKRLGDEAKSKMLEGMPKLGNEAKIGEEINNANNQNLDNKNIENTSNQRRLFNESRTDDEHYGDFTKSIIDDVKIGHTDIPSVASIKGEFDIKGLKIGMKFEEAVEKIRSSLSEPSRPQSSNLPGCSFNRSSVTRNVLNSGIYPMGDLIIVCKDTYVFFGTKILYSNFVFSKKAESEEMVLTLIKMGRIPSQKSNTNPTQDLIGALIAKFEIEPEIINESYARKKSRGVENVRSTNFIWTDDFLSLYRVEDFAQMQHRVGSDYEITLSEKNYYSTAEKRKKFVKEKQLDALDKTIQRRSKDL